MYAGLLAGFFWGLDTVILGVALASSSFVTTEQAIFFAPFISTFIHDLCSTLWMLLYMGIKRQYKEILKALRTKSGKFIILAALVGGPIGMTGYVLSIKYIGAAYTAIISALFPAVGAFLSYMILKEKMTKIQMVGLSVSILGVIILGYTPGEGTVTNGWIGIIFALMCVFGWASEAVIIAHGLKDPTITDEQALQIRQGTSALFYGIVLLPLLSGWTMTFNILTTSTSAIILFSALFGTTSYLFYYKAINKIGASKAMALNITYCAWAIGFGYLLLNEVLNVKDTLSALIIIGGSITAGGDIKELISPVLKKVGVSK
ncbi:DMT family transporter [Enterococcus sp. LJL98]